MGGTAQCRNGRISCSQLTKYHKLSTALYSLRTILRDPGAGVRSITRYGVGSLTVLNFHNQ